MLNLDPAKLLVILVVALVILGPERLPQVARQIGTAWRTLTNLREQVTEEVRRALPEVGELPRMPRPGSVSSFLNDLTRPGGTEGNADAVASAAATGAARRSSGPVETIGFDDPGMN
ncbi:MAG TPA: twin-arginine translocase TatA/TatE family subunit [Acidimicrobiales bacterium]|nr:twin-arginine translocase TatA/TatE family subunit [Acidimicrobiales bacterium]